MIPQSLLSKLREAKQDHVLKFYDEGKLSTDDAKALIQELNQLDLNLINSIFQASKNKSENADLSSGHGLEPLEEVDVLDRCSDQSKQHWWSLGLKAISRGELCTLVMGGGQGTRLGYDGPKGMYNIGLPSEKSLFQLFAERVLKLQWLANATFPNEPLHAGALIPFLVMTSVMNHETTVAFFREHNYFGLEESQVFFFPQGTLPCLSVDGKLLLETPSKLATASDGNGGIYNALSTSGAIGYLQQRGVKYLHVFSVDNVLCKVGDPTFIGYCIDKNADCGNKVVWKNKACESVGVVAKRNGHYCIVEYSEMDKATSELVDTTGALVYGAANICNHFFTLSFLTDVVIPNMSLAYHIAHKKIPIVNNDGKTYTPDTNSGIKLEAFIFDVFPLSSRMAVLAVPRETEFAPVKNAPGGAVDTPESARRMLYQESKSWLMNAVASVPTDKALLVSQKLEEAIAIEISSLVSYHGEGIDNLVQSLYNSPSRPIVRFESPDVSSTRYSIPPSIRKQFDDAKQGHVFTYVDKGEVSAHQACVLVEDHLRNVDPSKLVSLFHRSVLANIDSQESSDVIAPLGENVVDALSLASSDTTIKWEQLGLDAVAKGKVAALVLGGGQGTRLGFAGPKGMYDIGLPSKCSLFEIFAQRIGRVQQLAQQTFKLSRTPCIPFVVMTSDMNHDETIMFFQQHSLFGLLPDQVHFFRQGTLPSFALDGKILLESKYTLSRASDGNGGLYPALQRSGMLEYLKLKANVEYLHVFSVDNVLCKVADPIFMGYCIDNNADCANKVVWKTRPEERVGVFATKNGRFCVVEYSELDTLKSERVDPLTGKLAFGAANICNHFYRIDFLTRCCELDTIGEYHIAHKKINVVDLVTNEMSTQAGIKLETFIFDVFQYATNMKVLCVNREDEFAPVKNAPGAPSDSPDTARHLVSEQCKRWWVAAGGTFDDTTNGLCEILPSVSYNGEGLEEMAMTMSPLELPSVLSGQTSKI